MCSWSEFWRVVRPAGRSTYVFWDQRWGSSHSLYQQRKREYVQELLGKGFYGCGSGQGKADVPSSSACWNSVTCSHGKLIWYHGFPETSPHSSQSCESFKEVWESFWFYVETLRHLWLCTISVPKPSEVSCFDWVLLCLLGGRWDLQMGTETAGDLWFLMRGEQRLNSRYLHTVACGGKVLSADTVGFLVCQQQFWKCLNFLLSLKQHRYYVLFIGKQWMLAYCTSNIQVQNLLSQRGTCYILKLNWFASTEF